MRNFCKSCAHIWPQNFCTIYRPYVVDIWLTEDWGLSRRARTHASHCGRIFPAAPSLLQPAIMIVKNVSGLDPDVIHICEERSGVLFTEPSSGKWLDVFLACLNRESPDGQISLNCAPTSRSTPPPPRPPSAVSALSLPSSASGNYVYAPDSPGGLRSRNRRMMSMDCPRPQERWVEKVAR